MLKMSKTTSPNKLFDYDYVTLYVTQDNQEGLIDKELIYGTTKR